MARINLSKLESNLVVLDGCCLEVLLMLIGEHVERLAQVTLEVAHLRECRGG